MVKITVQDAELLAEILETALADPGFIDTTSGGGMSEQEADELRDKMRVLQRHLMSPR